MNTATILLLVLQEFISLPHGGVSTSNDTTATKAPLRYGFHKVDDCQEYTKAFLCIRKCLDLKFDVAHSDKHCKCTCFHKKDKAKFTRPWTGTQTNWRLGPPTTSKPIWAQPTTKNTPQKKINVTAEAIPSHSNETDETIAANNSDNAANTTGKIEGYDAQQNDSQVEKESEGEDTVTNNENSNNHTDTNNVSKEEDSEANATAPKVEGESEDEATATDNENIDIQPDNNTVSEEIENDATVTESPDDDANAAET